MSLDSKSATVALQAALESCKESKLHVVHHHGSQFVNRDVATGIKTHSPIDIKAKLRHPESNAIVERINGTARDEAHSND